MTLESVLTAAKAEAASLRTHGHGAQAASLERLVVQVEAAAVDYLTWLTEDEAVSRSDKRPTWFRARFAQWETQGMAERNGRVRLYRQVIVPRRPNLEAARADALRQAKAA